MFALREELLVEGKKNNCRSPFAARRKAVTQSDGASYAANFFVTSLGSKLWFIAKKPFYNLYLCLFGFTALNRKIHTFLALRVSAPSVV